MIKEKVNKKKINKIIKSVVIIFLVALMLVGPIGTLMFYVFAG